MVCLEGLRITVSICRAESFLIRKYRPEDRVELRKIACDTAFRGDCVEHFFDDRDIMADALTSQFIDYEPESCFVAVHRDKVVGYLIGSRDVRRSRKLFICKVLPRLLVKAVVRRALFSRKNRTFSSHVLRSFIKGEFRIPDYSAIYPATLHINVDRDFRGKGIGSGLIGAYLNYLAEQGVRGAHLETMSETAASFFEKQGFQLLYSREQSYFRYLLRTNISLMIF